VRGLSLYRRFQRCLGGSTPARAGIMASISRQAVTLWEHPRACGDYLSPARSRPCLLGAPPRVRGLFIRSRIPKPFRGSTPARAGIIITEVLSLLPVKEHPRACGDYF